MLPMKLGISFEWEELNWKDYYYLSNDIIDAAVFWKKGGYVKNTLMCLSFQFKKHINIGRGGMILTDDKDARDMLIKLSYDGREREKPWMEQNISHLGYHYYLTPESAAQGIEIFNKKKDEKPKNWSYRDYPVLNNMKVFK